MPIFNDSENKQPNVLAADGDYIFTVVGLKTSISKGPKTSGSDVFELTFELDRSPGSTVYEKLMDHPSTSWKLDCFLKSAGVDLVKWEGYSFIQSEASSNGFKWVNPFGLRGWCRIGREKYTGSDQKEREKNVVVTFYTGKAKVPRVEVQQPDEDEEAPF
jgi:hypothetical protein